MAVSRNKPSSNLPEHVAAFLAARVAPGQPLCLGLSGGRDSVVLLNVLSRTPWAAALSVVHVHHGLSSHADAWAAHCQALCEALSLPCQVLRVAVPADSGFGLEAAARDARYAAFAEVACDHLVLAHHQGDQAETMLFNLLRGAGVTGAKGMAAERQAGRQRILRPLLDVPAADIAAYAEAEGLVWVEDDSNANTAFSRNFLRQQIMPALSSRFPAAASQLAKAAAHFAEADALLGELAALDWETCSSDEGLRIKSLRGLSEARIRNLLRWRLQQLAWRAPAAPRLDEFVRQLLTAGPEGRPRLDLPDGVLLLRRQVVEFAPAALT